MMSEPKTDSRCVYRAEGLRHEYAGPAGSIPVLNGVDLSLYSGEMVAIMGPSGSGKSTLLFILGLLLSPDAGSCRADGEELLVVGQRQRAAFRRRYLGFVFQSANLLEHTSVYENLEFPLLFAGVPGRDRDTRIRSALQKVGLEHRVDQPANHLSGGEQQRVAIARALINRPRLILADEPTGQLDCRLRDQLMANFRRVAEEDGAAVTVVTHDSDVAQCCDRIFQLHEGRLNLVGSPEEE